MSNPVGRWRQQALFRYLGQHFGCFWVQEETNDCGKLQEELGFLEELGARGGKYVLALRFREHRRPRGDLPAPYRRKPQNLRSQLALLVSHKWGGIVSSPVVIDMAAPVSVAVQCGCISLPWEHRARLRVWKCCPRAKGLLQVGVSLSVSPVQQ